MLRLRPFPHHLMALLAPQPEPFMMTAEKKSESGILRTPSVIEMRKFIVENPCCEYPDKYRNQNVDVRLQGLQNPSGRKAAFSSLSECSLGKVMADL